MQEVRSAVRSWYADCEKPCESEKNVGTTFRLKIPFKIDDCVHIEEPTEEEHNVSIEGVRVLVAEIMTLIWRLRNLCFHQSARW